MNKYVELGYVSRDTSPILGRSISQNVAKHTCSWRDKHKPNTQRKITLEKISKKISDTYPFLASPPFLWEKSEPTPFLKNFENWTPPPLALYKKGEGEEDGGVQLWRET